ncbi:MAG: glycoside hydrolase/phage tail family protein [Hyphomonadaceae bacterium]
MAQIAFSALGQAAGSTLLPQGIGALEFSISGTAIGGALGGFIGSRIDGAIFGNTTEGPRIESIRLMESREGAGIPNVYGRMRVGGQVIWAVRLRETRTTEQIGGGKGGPRVANFTYSASFAVALCEGEINRVDRVWSNGEVIALSDLPHRLYFGTEDQMPDPLIEAIEGAGCAPAYRGTAYLVFEDLPLEQFGNRLPQLSFEIYREVANGRDIERVSELVDGVNLIPASGEFVYGTEPVRQNFFPNIETPENTHTSTMMTDMLVSLDQLERDLPRAKNVALTVGWFGDDLRVGHCQIRPGVERREKDTRPYDWFAGGVDRDDAWLITSASGDEVADAERVPNYGGTPADRAVVQGIREMNARGMAVTMSPFLFMDVAPGNGLADPYGGTEQAAFPWRGRITGADKSAATASEVASFLGQARPDDFEIDGDTVRWRGDDDDWGFRRFILHHAWLVRAAGGVEAFLLGSEMIGISRLRDDAGGFPFVSGLVALAQDVRAILGPQVKISYAADWTEYGAYAPIDGSGDILFPLDRFWGDSNVNFIGVDWYPPVGDWRDGDEHLDALAGFRGADDPDYLRNQQDAGEAFDWFYASDADRQAQIRTPIVDTAHGEHWVFRQKDLLGWWNAIHHERPNGVRQTEASAWRPASKPIRLSEIGFPAIDKGGNAPNLFFDPKSSESALPPFSNGERDDVFQQSALSVALSFWQGQQAVEATYVWAWDARPFPVFPVREDIWADGENWTFGHWLNGRAGVSELGLVLSDICARGGVLADADEVTGLVAGFTLTGVSTVRAALAPLMSAHGIEAIEREGRLVFRHRGNAPVRDVSRDELTEEGVNTTRQLLDKAPGALRLTYIGGDEGYQPATVEARVPDGDRSVVIDVSLPLLMTEARAQTVADYMLAQAAGTDGAALGLGLAHLDLEAGDGVRLIGDERIWRVSEVNLAAHQMLQLETDTGELAVVRTVEPASDVSAGDGLARPDVWLIDGPVLPDMIGDRRPLLAGVGTPWPRPSIVSAGLDASQLSVRAELPERAGVGRLIGDLAAGPLGRWDEGAALLVTLPGEQLASFSALAALSGGQPVLVQNQTGWEMISYRDAELIGPDQYRLTGLLRGLSGSQILAVDAGALCVVLDGRLGRGNIGQEEIGLELVWQAEGRGVSGRILPSIFDDKAGLEFAPVHLARGQHEAGGQYVSWVRRGAEIRDNWVGPAAENVGRFAVEVLREGEVIAAKTVDEPRCELSEVVVRGDVLRVCEIGSDGRSGWPAQLVL